ncbi:MAG: hypothetical protein WCG83_01955 [Candidatus Peregrinibacteria bacterium]
MDSQEGLQTKAEPAENADAQILRNAKSDLRRWDASTMDEQLQIAAGLGVDRQLIHDAQTTKLNLQRKIVDSYAKPEEIKSLHAQLAISKRALDAAIEHHEKPERVDAARATIQRRLSFMQQIAMDDQLRIAGERGAADPKLLATIRNGIAKLMNAQAAESFSSTEVEATILRLDASIGLLHEQIAKKEKWADDYKITVLKTAESALREIKDLRKTTRISRETALLATRLQGGVSNLDTGEVTILEIDAQAQQLLRQCARLKPDLEADRAFKKLDAYLGEFPLEIRTRNELIGLYDESGEESSPERCIIRCASPQRDRVARINFNNGDYLEVRGEEGIELPVVSFPEDGVSGDGVFKVKIPPELSGKTGMNSGNITLTDVRGQKVAELLQKFSVIQVQECIALFDRAIQILKKNQNSRTSHNDDYEWDKLRYSIANRIGELMGLKTGELLRDTQMYKESGAWYYLLSSNSIGTTTGESRQRYIEDLQQIKNSMSDGIRNAKPNDVIYIDMNGLVKTDKNVLPTKKYSRK